MGSLRLLGLKSERTYSGPPGTGCYGRVTLRGRKGVEQVTARAPHRATVQWAGIAGFRMLILSKKRGARRRGLTIILVLSAALGLPRNARADAAPRGEAIFKARCAACHSTGE